MSRPEGVGAGAGPALNSGRYRHGGADGTLFQTIGKGIAGTTMPAFSNLTALHNWLTYNGSYASTHHSLLSELHPGNVKNLQLQWAWQSNSPDKIQAAPLVVDGVMYLTDPPNDVVALDARTGRVFWRYAHNVPAGVLPCCGRVNRGLAILGNTRYFGTLDARLIALDASTGRNVGTPLSQTIETAMR